MTDEAKALVEREGMQVLLPPAAGVDGDYLMGWLEGQAYLISIYGTDEASDQAFTVAHQVHRMQNLIETQAREIERLREALSQWLTKTEWVVQTGQKHELGMHRADMLRNRIERQAAEIEWLKSPGKWEQIAETESSQIERDAAAELASLLWRTFPAFAQRIRDNRSVTASFFVRHDEAVRAPLLAEIERLTIQLEVESEPSPYCPICGSCGEDGCCGPQRCLYPTTEQAAELAKFKALAETLAEALATAASCLSQCVEGLATQNDMETWAEDVAEALREYKEARDAS